MFQEKETLQEGDHNETVIISKAKVAALGQMFDTADWWDIILMIIGTLGGIATGIAIPICNVLFGRILNHLGDSSASDFRDKINEVCLDLVIIGSISLVSGFCQVYCWSTAGERQTQRFRTKYVHAVLSQEIGWFDTCGVNELSTKLVEAIAKIQEGIGRKIGDLIQYIAQVVASFAISFYLSWKLTIVLIAAIPAIGAAGAFMINAITAAQTKSHEQYAAAGGLATELLSAIRTVNALNMQGHSIAQYRKYLVQAMYIGIEKGFSMGLGNGSLFCACFLTYSLGFWYGGKLIADDMENGCTSHCTSGGNVLAVFLSTVMGSMALGQIAPPLSSVYEARVALASILEIIDRKPLIDGLSTEGIVPTADGSTSKKDSVKASSGSIVIADLHFAYPSRPSVHICQGYNLQIHSGETVALVGKSGCGKSTIINLLMRFYDPLAGTIHLDEHNIKDLNIQYLRAQFGYVGQEPILFSGSIADNIAYGFPPTLRTEYLENKSDTNFRDRIIAAAKLANAHEFISSFPSGYDTDVGNNGLAMSGGQKQRIAIARALIKKPAVLLLDEATSALDAASERVVQESIDTLAASKSQTTIIIAHRLSTIRNADKIVVINEGKVVEVGRHEELITLPNGIYADLVRLQMSTLTVDDNHHESDPDPTLRDVNIIATPSTVAAVSTPNVIGTADEEVLPSERQKEVRRRIYHLLINPKGHLALLLIGCIGAFIFGGVFPCWGIMVARTLSIYYQPDPDDVRADASMYGCFYILLAGVSLIFSTAQFYGVTALGERVTFMLRSERFESLMRRSMAYFDDVERHNLTTLTAQLANDAFVIHRAFGNTLARQLQAMATLCVGLGIALDASWKIALVVIACFPLSIGASAVQMQAMQGQQYDTDDGDNTGDENDKKSKSAQKNGREQVPQEEVAPKSDANGKVLLATAFLQMRTISAFSMQHHILNDYSQATEKISLQRIKRSIIAGIGFGGSQLALSYTYAVLFWYGAKLIANGEITMLQLMTAILALMMGAMGLGHAMADLGDTKLAITVADRIFRDIDEGKKSEIDGLSTAGNILTTKENTLSIGKCLKFENVNFHYPTRPEIEVCQNFCLTIEPGETVALVGPSGCGKSTIVNLLLRFYNVDSGSITMDGTNINELNVPWLRSQIGYVGQEPVLFSGTIRENVLRGKSSIASFVPLEDALRTAAEEYHRSHSICTSICGHAALSASYVALPPDADISSASIEGEKDIEMAVVKDNGNEEVVAACKAANAHDFISSFPQGYDTDVGSNGLAMSGGQKQRIAIARALIKKPTVLLLDEATSALDASSERVVQESIDALASSKSQTTIIIAHRLSTIRNADKIVVIDRGMIKEIGKHDDLLSLDNGIYKRLWRSQQQASSHHL